MVTALVSSMLWLMLAPVRPLRWIQLGKGRSVRILEFPLALFGILFWVCKGSHPDAALCTWHTASDTKSPTHVIMFGTW